MASTAPARLQRVARALAWLCLGLGGVALVAALVKGDGYAPALAGLAVGAGILVTVRSSAAR